MSDPQVSNRAKIESFVAMDVMAEANRRDAAGADIIHMEIGQPAHKQCTTRLDSDHV
jgi:aspartate/methionine/tyrosine aminotransferase